HLRIEHEPRGRARPEELVQARLGVILHPRPGLGAEVLDDHLLDGAVARVEALLGIRDPHAVYGHVREVVVQNSRAKPGTRMEDHAEPSLDELLWTCAAARLVLRAEMNLQAPPN